MLKGLNGPLFRGHLEEGETAVMVVHRHWLSGIRHLFWPSLFLAPTLALLYVTRARQPLLIANLIGVLALSCWWIRNFFDYYLDAWIITDHGIIDIQWHGLFHRESARVLYSDLQGVSYEIKGIVPTLLRYGTISVEKISTGSEIAMSHVHNPRSIEAIVLQNMESYLHRKNMKNANHVQEMLAEIIAERVQLQQFSDE